MYLTEHFASFIAHTNYEDLPQDVIVQAKERIMDTVGAAIAGCCNWEYPSARQSQPWARAIVRFWVETPSTPLPTQP